MCILPLKLWGVYHKTVTPKVLRAVLFSFECLTVGHIFQEFPVQLSKKKLTERNVNVKECMQAWNTVYSVQEGMWQYNNFFFYFCKFFLSVLLEMIYISCHLKCCWDGNDSILYTTVLFNSISFARRSVAEGIFHRLLGVTTPQECSSVLIIYILFLHVSNSLLGLCFIQAYLTPANSYRGKYHRNSKLIKL